MPLRLILIYLLSCLSDILAYAFNPDAPNYVSAVPPLCLLVFYYSGRKNDYKLKDYTYSFGLIFASIADLFFEFSGEISQAVALIIYMLSYSFYIATVRHEAVFGTHWKDLLKVIGNIALIIAPVLIAAPDIDSFFYFASLIYMVFLALLYVTALMRKTNRSSYIWFLSGAVAFAILTASEVYFMYLNKSVYHIYFQKLFYLFAQYAIFMGVTKSFKNFYSPNEK